MVFNNSDQSVAGYVRFSADPGTSEARHRGPELATLLGAGPGGEEILKLHDRRIDFEVECTCSQLVSVGLELKLAGWQALVLSPSPRR